MAVTPAFEPPFEYPDATWKRALGSGHANTWTDLLRDLPGDQQQARPARSVGIVDSFMKSRRVSVADMLHIPSLEKITNGLNRVELSCGKRVPRSAFLGVRRVALR
jgi:hypothetical protein